MAHHLPLHYPIFVKISIKMKYYSNYLCSFLGGDLYTLSVATSKGHERGS
jgi:hypothetical protein